MRRNIVAGLCLAAAAGLIVVASAAFDLGLESAALLGGALGAVVVLVPDRTAAVRLGGFAAGLVVAWIGYVARASALPDTAGGRAVAVMVVVIVCVGLNAATRDRLPVWTLLLGLAGFAGAYEFTYDQAPPELLSTSISTATTLIFNVAAGFLAASFLAPVARGGARGFQHREPVAPADDRHIDLTGASAQ
ncbi:MAG: hypothetical protein ACTHNS_05775 [Marmoricola sp.]